VREDAGAAPITALTTRTYTVPTDQPEADGTLAWDATTVVTATVEAGGQVGLGWTYAAGACGSVIDEKLAHALLGRDAFAVAGSHEAMVRACRNLGRPGIVASAISAVDIALWDCKARLLGISLASLFGRSAEGAPIYGSGGFTTYDDETARSQLELWVDTWGLSMCKIKVGESWGTCEGRDLRRAALARQVVGAEVALFVDANGGYSRKQAVRMGRRYLEEAAVTWFEEPVSSDDLVGLRMVRDTLDLDVAAGEYGYDEPYFARMIGAGSVDCLQIDVTRCGGYTSWLRAASLAGANGLDVSGHCAPNLHAHVAVSVPHLRHIEYFHDHHRVDGLLFDGVLAPGGGFLVPDDTSPGHGMTLKEADAAPYRR